MMKVKFTIFSMSLSQDVSIDQIISNAYQLLEEFELMFRSIPSPQINEQKEGLKDRYNKWLNEGLELLIDSGFNQSFIFKFKNTRSNSAMYRAGNPLIQYYIKDLQAKIEVLEQKQSELKAVPPLNSSVVIQGGYQNFAMNNNGDVSQSFVINNDFESLREALLKYGIENKDIDELHEIVKKERPNGTSLGSRAKEWVGKISIKLGNVGLNVGAGILAKAILTHYGIAV